MGILFRYLQTAIVNLSVSVFLIRTVAPGPYFLSTSRSQRAYEAEGLSKI